MRFVVLSIFVVAASLILSLSTGSAAVAAGTGLTICNKTSAILGVAIGYHSPGVNDPADHSLLTGPFVSHGWWGVQPGQCRTLGNPFGARYMFWFAFSSESGFNGADILPSTDPHAFNSTKGLWETNGNDFFCLTSFHNNPSHINHQTPGFTYEDENESEAACHRGSYNLWVPVRKVDTLVDATVNFTGS